MKKFFLTLFILFFLYQGPIVEELTKIILSWFNISFIGHESFFDFVALFLSLIPFFLFYFLYSLFLPIKGSYSSGGWGMITPAINNFGQILIFCSILLLYIFLSYQFFSFLEKKKWGKYVYMLMGGVSLLHIFLFVRSIEIIY